MRQPPNFIFVNPTQTEQMSPRHHDMACPQVADGEAVSIGGGSCKYIESAVAEGQLGMVLQFEGLTR